MGRHQETDMKIAISIVVQLASDHLSGPVLNCSIRGGSTMLQITLLIPEKHNCVLFLDVFTEPNITSAFFLVPLDVRYT